MTSWQYLTLDTTAPTLTINVPQYTTRDIVNFIEIISNENLALNGHDIYIIDSQNNRYNLNVSTSGNKLLGYFQFDGYSLGPATLYVSAYDEVLNKSDIFEKSFNILDSFGRLKVLNKERTTIVKLTEKNNKSLLKERSTKTTLADKGV